MTITIRLTDLQLVLLSGASARDDGSLMPLPESIAEDDARIGKAVTSLLRRNLVAEISVTDRKLAWREHHDDVIGLFVTEVGRKAIGAQQPDTQGITNGGDDIATGTMSNTVLAKKAGNAATDSPARPTSKIGSVIELLEPKKGATLAEMVEATGWQPQTTRAALTGLRKRGYATAKTKRVDVTCYHIAGGA